MTPDGSKGPTVTANDSIFDDDTLHIDLSALETFGPGANVDGANDSADETDDNKKEKNPRSSLTTPSVVSATLS